MRTRIKEKKNHKKTQVDPDSENEGGGRSSSGSREARVQEAENKHEQHNIEQDMSNSGKRVAGSITSLVKNTHTA